MNKQKIIAITLGSVLGAMIMPQISNAVTGSFCIPTFAGSGQSQEDCIESSKKAQEKQKRDLEEQRADETLKIEEIIKKNQVINAQNQVNIQYQQTLIREEEVRQQAEKLRQENEYKAKVEQLENRVKSLEAQLPIVKPLVSTPNTVGSSTIVDHSSTTSQMLPEKPTWFRRIIDWFIRVK